MDAPPAPRRIGPLHPWLRPEHPRTLDVALLEPFIERDGTDEKSHWWWTGEIDAKNVPIYRYREDGGSCSIYAVSRALFQAENALPRNASLHLTCGYPMCIRPTHWVQTSSSRLSRVQTVVAFDGVERVLPPPPTAATIARHRLCPVCFAAPDTAHDEQRHALRRAPRR